MKEDGKKANEEPFGEELVHEILRSGVDLRAYSKRIESELKSVEDGCVGDYIGESVNIARLHEQINDCDGVLGRLEERLCAFQAALGNICQEILSLQEQSVALNVRLKNKQLVRGELSQFIDDIAVPQDVITHVLGTPASEKEFLEQLHVLDAKIAFVKEQSFKDAAACADVLDILNSLKARAVVKVREYVLKRVQSTKKPMSNFQIPQNALLKNKFFFTFLQTHSRETAREVLDEYVDTLGKVYFSYYKEYSGRVARLKHDEVADKDDLMAADDITTKSARTSFFNSKPVLKNRSTIFTLGDRGNVLTTDLEAPSIFPHVASKSDMKYPLEAIFRSVQFALLDNACREYLFLTEFFNVNAKRAQELFNAIYTRTLTFLLRAAEDDFGGSFDSVALFLCLHLVYRYRLMAHKRVVPALDAYYESLVKLIWPRFEHVLQLNINSVKHLDTARLSGVDTRPHYITRRYAEFSASLAQINETFPDERVSLLLGCMQHEVENFLLKLAARFEAPKEQLVFVINNYDLALSVFLEKSKDETAHEDLKRTLQKRVADYVDELLYPFFGGLITFVKDCEPLVERHEEEALKREEEKIAAIVKAFNANWRKAVEDISRQVLGSFSNFRCGNNIQQTALAQLIQYYHRFHKIVSASVFRNHAARNSLMNIHQLMVEIKKYKTNF